MPDKKMEVNNTESCTCHTKLDCYKRPEVSGVGETSRSWDSVLSVSNKKNESPVLQQDRNKFCQ